MDAKRLLDSFIAMTAIESPSRKEAAMAAYLKEQLDALGAQVLVDDSAAQTGSDTGNLIAHIDGTVPGHIAFSSHMDTVVPCAGIRARIEKRPALSCYAAGALPAGIAPEDEVDVVCSEGDTILSSDDKAGLAAILEGVRAVVEDASPRPSLTLVLTTCEEQSLLGAAALSPDVFSRAAQGDANATSCAKDPVPCFVLDADGHPGSIVVAAPFHYTMRAEFAGKAAHAGVEPEAGASAIAMAADAVLRMPPARVDECTTSNVGRIEGGAAVNIVPDSCVLEGECRSLHEDRVNGVRDAMQQACEDAAEAAGGQVRVTWTLDYPGIFVAEDSPVVEHLKAAAQACGLVPTCTVSGGGADANILGTKGACSVTLGVGMTNFHSVQEFITVRDLEDSARFVEAIIREYARS